jgi:chromosome segregation ATPase
MKGEGKEDAMTAEGTATKADDLKQKLAQHLDAARSKLEALKRDISSMHEEDMDALRQRRAEMQKRLDGQKQRAQKLQAGIASWREKKVAHTEEAIGSWRKRRELEKLQARAEDAEAFAVDLVNVAALDFEEAEQAVLDAVSARYEADAAAAPAT